MKRALATLVAQAVGGGLSLWHYVCLPVLGPRRQEDDIASLPLLSVVVPARNEEARLGRLLTSLVEQDYPAVEVIVVDDRSTDRTAEIARGVAGVRVVQGAEPPVGWAGKPHACAHGAAFAGGKWLLFVDADIALRPDALARAVGYAEEQHLGFLSLFLRQECDSFWERLLLPYAYAQYFAGVNARAVNAPASSHALANGQFMLFRRDVYAAIGGHAAVADSLIDDVALAALLKRRGIAMRMVRGEALGQVHMYDGLGTLWEGFVKNAFGFVRYNVRGAPAVIGGSLAVGSSLPTLLQCLNRARRAPDTRRRTVLLTLGLAAYGVPAALLAPWYRRFGVRRRYTLAHPLAFGVFQAIALTSAWRTLTRQGVKWKGRSYRGATARPYYRLPRRHVIELGLALLAGQRRLVADDGARLVASLARKPRIEGAEHIPATGPVCLAANHYQRWGLWIGWEGGVLAAEVAARRAHDRDLHLLVIGSSRVGPLFGRWWTVPGTRSLFARVARTWGMVVMPVGPREVAERARAVRRLLSYALGSSGDGGTIGLFPEGEQGGATGLRPALPGVGSLFRVLGRRGVPVVPAAMYEDGEGIVVRFGPPLIVARGSGADADEAAATAVMRGIAALLPTDLQGVYGALTT